MLLSDDINGIIFSEDYDPNRPSKYFINDVEVEYKFYCERFDEELQIANSANSAVASAPEIKQVTRLK